MKTSKAVIEKIDGVFYVSKYISYSNNKHVKRIYTINGELVDAIPLKNYSNTK